MSRPSRGALAHVLMLLSGFAGLGYQIVWTQQATLWLGHEAAAVLAVVAAFFGGLALGSFVLAPRIERMVRPQRAYAVCEAVIGSWSIVLAALLAPLSDRLLLLVGAQPSPLWQWTIAFAGTFVVLLPATVAMGATLPAMQRIAGQLASHGRGIGALYASNTAGALLGVLGSALLLVPRFGLLRTALACAALNLLCAVAALALPAPAPAATAAPGRIGGVGWRLAATGLLGIGYEVLVVRVLSQVAEDTVYTFALLLAVYLVGTALGAAAWQRLLAARPERAQVRDRLLLAQALACLLGASTLWGASTLRAVIEASLGGVAGALAAEAILALAAFGLPTLVMGALFSHLAAEALEEQGGLGRALGLNTVGAALAPLLFGVLAAPLVGSKFALLCVSAGYALLARPQRQPIALGAGLVVTILALALMAPPLAFVDVPAGGRVIDYREGTLAAVSVVEDAQGVATLRIDNRQQEGSSATRLADGRQAWLPLLLHPAPHDALFLGLGTGVTARAATLDPALRVQAVELLPEVVEAASLFRSDSRDGAGLQVREGDARRFVRTGTTPFDVIVADNFHPARSGSGALYTVEHFRAVRARLAPGGVFCQWLPLHQLDLPTLRSIVRSFLEAYPQASAALATHSLETPVIALLGRADDGRFALADVDARLRDHPRTAAAASYGFDDSTAVLGTLIAGPRALARFAGDAPLNTDDHPMVAYLAPRITYAPDSAPRERLFALLDEWQVADGEAVDGGADRATPARLSAYRRARDHFLRAGRDVRPTADVRDMLAQVREPLLAVLRESPDFRPAAEPLRRMAEALADQDPAAARALLLELQQLQAAP